MFRTPPRVHWIALPLLGMLFASSPAAGAQTPRPPARDTSSVDLAADSLRADSLRADSLHVAPSVLDALRSGPSGMFRPDSDLRVAPPRAGTGGPLGAPGSAPRWMASLSVPPPPDSFLVSTAARRPDPLRLGLAVGAIAGANAAIFAWEKSRWWEGSLDEFHFDDHLDYAANVDKAAHFYGTEIQALGVARVLEGAGLTRNQAALGGAASGWLMQLQVEYHDGFYPQWGFDRYDLAANTLGAAWFYGRERVPALRRFDTRWGYVPQDPNPALWFNEDYQRHTYWVTARVWDVLPEPAQAVWPRALRLSAGMAVADWDPADPYETGHAELYLSVDVDYEALLPTRTLLGRTLADALSRIHLPAPAIRLAPEPRVYLIFYGQ